MLSDWLWLFALSALFVAVQSLPAGLGDAPKKTEETTRPKVKRSQELLMFGNQQNHQSKGNAAAKDRTPSVEKRTLSNSGLEDVSAVLSEAEQQGDSQPKALPSSYMMDQPAPQHERNYAYGRILVNEMDDVLPRGPWDLNPGSSYGRYYGGLSAEDRRKRSQDSNSPTPASAAPPATTSKSIVIGNPANSGISGSTAAPASAAAAPAAYVPSTQSFFSQPKRSLPSYYPEPRYKRELDVDPDKLYALLSLYDSELRNRGNWRSYGNEEYETVDDNSNMILDDEDPSVNSWLDNPASGYPQQHQYFANEPLLNTELAALGHANRPYGYYDPYLGQQYAGGASGVGQQYDTGVQYGTPQYTAPYSVHGSYYPPEKRFMVSRKRSQNYDSYGGRSGILLNSRAYPGYQHRLLY